uniref:Aldehyde dehydrogenase n=1 Tax=Trieres chinensis TaxID=1514140 RepID=A0A7S2E9H0_TRICV|mmetsp:Transcript_13726/g.28251  ORF Transcript_13726/g.28251 Transcript_13726/m.28251 type:complete len:536 (+) Transcript_13726:60-1667(+)
MPSALPSSHHNGLNISSLIRPMEETHESGVNRNLDWRLDNLRAMRNMISDHADDFQAALRSDLGHVPEQADVIEFSTIRSEIEFMISKLGNWMRPEKVPSPGFLAPSFSEVRRMPLTSPGVLVLGPSNYPLSLTIVPAVGSLAGGNPAIIKPSELCPATSGLLARVVPEYFKRGALQVVEGGVKETSELLKQKWGLIFFTGSERVGKIVARAAAETLTPTVLELGGKVPVFIAQDCPDMRVVSDRLAWGKTLNCGQSCISPDYVVCHEEHVEHLCDELVKSLDRMFGKDPQKSAFSRIVSVSHAKRHLKLIKEVEKSGAKIICGGSEACDVEDKYIAPTIVLDPPQSCRLMTEEIFGPILPIVTVKSTQSAINEINKKPGIPLSLCVFTSSLDLFEHIISTCPAAGVHHNDCVVSYSSKHLPFGGLGTSGYGRYHGRYTFETFTHAMPVVGRPCHRLSEFGGLRYAPYKGSKLTILAMRLPYIPVIHTRKCLGLIFASLLVMYIPALQPVKMFTMIFLLNMLGYFSKLIKSGISF